MLMLRKMNCIGVISISMQAISCLERMKTPIILSKQMAATSIYPETGLAYSRFRYVGNADFQEPSASVKLLI